MASKAVFLDRDGTIIVDKVYLNDPNGVEYLDGALDALKKLAQNNFKLFVVTNQSGIARGIVDMENLKEIHRRIHNHLKVAGISISAYMSAPFSVESDHWLRKPNPGMIIRLAQAFDIDVSQSWMIGDRETDVKSGQKAGCKTALISESQSLDCEPDVSGISLASLVDTISHFDA
ncbi:MAG: hypothetical protein COT74_06445 [Bdellovibrionales bacterium CG10_big_fil_rev_8_21_14_0_10_45_34]|nr:MAG: hypothetical protein COT74_06445 [Bdellovibrionales bacterium CG10_big_fil_rev_8_21_14_0_10_45_34]